MTINPRSIDVLSLPFVGLENRSCLPVSHGIYFAIDSKEAIQYIGSATGKKGLRQRWYSTSHHKYDDALLDSQIRIAYLEIDAPIDLILEVELDFIQWFQPPLNKAIRRVTR